VVAEEEEEEVEQWQLQMWEGVSKVSCAYGDSLSATEEPLSVADHSPVQTYLFVRLERTQKGFREKTENARLRNIIRLEILINSDEF